jgi:phosphoserine phosphatase
MKLAIYDLDYTLCKSSTLKIFYKYLLNRKYISPCDFLKIQISYIKYKLKCGSLKELKESVLLPLKGKNKTEIEHITESFLDVFNKDDFREELANRIMLEKNEGFYLILLTGSPEVMMRIIQFVVLKMRILF